MNNPESVSYTHLPGNGIGIKVETDAGLDLSNSIITASSLRKNAFEMCIRDRVGTHAVSSIKTAEAIKVVENSQRDINIAFMNELAIVFDRMGIDLSLIHI